MRGLILTLLFSTTAFAGDVRFNVNFGNWRVGNQRQTRAYVPYYPTQPYYYYWVYSPPPPAPPPQVIYIEREREPEREPAPAPPPQVVVVQLPPVEPAPAPAPVAEPVVAAPVVAAPVAPLPPRVPGPDVFQWTDEDGVVNYSTRVPADARKRAKKLSTLAK